MFSGNRLFSSNAKNSLIVRQPDFRLSSSPKGASDLPSPQLMVVIPCVSRLRAAP
jgi:hypothetical protein